ncbi:putative 28S ribosomal protein S25 [Schistosoma japonicum]|uniref:Small ribosomal subunit protein mS25 n=1 Tax=Schistosoma japonicum TaxID=6182 RepID=Q5DDM5_SCHJA|nr:SJCHGC02544 protein [Schistosoma japonicum]KAH8860349.1 putative 28S ribosomal protein S25, mitochondrial [Schistosoma japonicum]TNN11668.1 putative 28S ribosomal protein S25 [Schistosoma japonicum]TNN11669.1 putative 28S ribosomal protein S25 [Schistosoma japonicum]TNN11670.1 putative 28S ribosomal protein S25 [Schistosoma japonicum]
MPFLKGGRAAVTRTKKYLEAGRILLNDGVKIIVISHIPGAAISHGCDEFIKWYLPPMQFRNPNIQIITFKNMFPTPFIKIYFRNEEQVVNCAFRRNVDIYDHLHTLLGKPLPSEHSLMNDLTTKNPSNFGTDFPRQCICEVYGQMPCSSNIGKPKLWSHMEYSLPTVDTGWSQNSMNPNVKNNE